VSNLKNFIYTKSFTFEKAQYRLSDNNGNDILLEVDYENNKYSNTALMNSNGGYGGLKKEAEKIAKDLLRRKHKVNFVKKD